MSGNLNSIVVIVVVVVIIVVSFVVFVSRKRMRRMRMRSRMRRRRRSGLEAIPMHREQTQSFLEIASRAGELPGAIQRAAAPENLSDVVVVVVVGVVFVVLVVVGVVLSDFGVG